MRVTKYLALLGVFCSQLQASITPERAQEIFELMPKSSHIEIQLDIKPTKNPGAFAKWKKTGESGVISLDQDLLKQEKTRESHVALLLCHEFGHFLGGAPFVQLPRSGSVMDRFMRNPYKGLSAEGQADYYSSASCLKQVFASIELPRSQKNYPECRQDGLRGFKMCPEILEAFLQQIQLYDEMMVSLSMPSQIDGVSLQTPSRAQVDKTLDTLGKYPSLQCRLDTLVAGLKCHNWDPGNKKCLDENSKRPSCWYKD